MFHFLVLIFVEVYLYYLFRGWIHRSHSEVLRVITVIKQLMCIKPYLDRSWSLKVAYRRFVN